MPEASTCGSCATNTWSSSKGIYFTGLLFCKPLARAASRQMHTIIKDVEAVGMAGTPVPALRQRQGVPSMKSQHTDLRLSVTMSVTFSSFVSDLGAGTTRVSL
eukprot:3602918-Rhodomonas_salina.2